MHTYPYCTYSPFFFQLRVQQSALKAGEAHYSSRVDDIRVLKMKVKVFIMNICNFTFNIQSNNLLLSCHILSNFILFYDGKLYLIVIVNFNIFYSNLLLHTGVERNVREYDKEVVK